MLRRLFVRPNPRKCRRACRLGIESLERRVVPAFIPGDIVVLRVGDGSAALSGAATAEFLDEYSPDGTLDLSITMPTTGSGLSMPITASGTDPSEGFLSRSTNGKYLMAVGYDANPGMASVADSSVPRVIGRIESNLTIDTTTSTSSFSGGNIRSAASIDGNGFWAAGANSGIVYLPFGRNSSGTVVADDSTDNRVVNVFDGQLYSTSGSGTDTFKGVSAVGTGTPTSTGNSFTRLPGLTDATNPSDYSFFLADLNPAVPGDDTMYVADDAAGVIKFSLVGGNWVVNNIIGSGSDGYRGLTGAVVGNTVTLYATSEGPTAPGLYSIVDTTGYNQNMTATPTLLVSQPANEAFRGVAFAPGNVSPVNTLPATFSAGENTSTVLAGISTGDADARSANVQVTFSVGSGTLNLSTAVANGVTDTQVSGNGTGTVVITAPILTINTTLADSAGLTYTPPANATGNVTLAMTTDDLGNTGGSSTPDSDSATIAISAVNQPPVNSVPGDQNGAEDTPITFSAGSGNAITVSDIDADGGDEKVTLSVNQGTLALGSTNNLTVTGNGSASVTLMGTIADLNAGMDGLKYTPNANYNGTDTLTVLTDDQGNTGTGGPQTDTDTVVVNLAAVNDPPVNSVPSSFGATEDTPAVLTGISTSDVDAGSASVQVRFSATNGTLTVATDVSGGVTAAQVSNNGTGSVVITAPIAAINATLADANGLTYLGSANFWGSETLTMATDDLGNTGSGGSMTDSDTATITINPVADTPSITPTTTNEDTQSTTGLVISRNPADGSEVGFFQITAITNGKLYQHDGTTQINNGDFISFAQGNAGLTFTPTPDFNGTATFGVQASLTNDVSGLGGSVVTAQVTVNPVNDPPVNTLPSNFSATEDTPQPLAGISTSDVDAGSANIQVTFSVPAGTGTLTVGTGVSGGVTAGQVSGNTTSSVVITAPIAAINATLADANGLTYLPAPNLNGDVTLTMATNDLGNTGAGGPQIDTDTADISIAAVNDPPTVSVPGDQTTAEDTPLVFQLANGNPITVADVDAGNGLKVTLTAQNGTLMLSTENNLTVIGDGTGTVVAIGAPANLNLALTGLTYTPDANYNGLDLIKVAADDQGNTGSGGDQSTFMNISLTVTSVNDPPVNVGPVAPNVAPATEDTPFAFAGDFLFVVDDVDAGTGDLTTTLTATHGTMTVTDGTGATVTGNGTAQVTVTGPLDELNASLAGLTYMPDANYNGPAEIDVSTNDLGNTGAGGPQTTADTFAISVASVNDPPVLGDYTFFLNGTVTVGEAVGTVTATDVDGDMITYSITGGDPGGNFAIDPSSGQITVASTVGLPETASLTVTATDNGTDNGVPHPLSDTGTVTINRNTAPTTGGIPNQEVLEDAAPIVLDLTNDFSDAEQSASTLTYSVTGNTNASLFQSVGIQGSVLTLMLAPNANGASDVTVTATDAGGLTVSSTFTVTVDPVNDAPTLDPISTVNIHEDDPKQTINLTGISTGPANESSQTLTITATSSDHTLFPDPTIVYTGGSTGTLSFQTLPNANGSASITVTVQDNGGTANGGVDTTTQTFTVNVQAEPDRPVIDTSLTNVLPGITLPIKKGTFPAGDPIDDLVTHFSDPDVGDPRGVAITGVDTTAGTWQYTLDGGTTWTNVPSVSQTSALLLPDNANTELRLLPSTKFKNKYAGIRFRAWDQTNGKTPGTLDDATDPSSNSYSLQTTQAWIAVGKPKPVVDAAGDTELTPTRPLLEDHKSGTFVVKNVLGLLGLESKLADPTRVYGIAITADTGGTWEYNLGKGGWQTIGAVSAGSALLLGPTARLKYVPSPNFNGTATLVYRTWDQTVGTPGTTADSAGSGFSSRAETAVLNVAPVNDAPVINPAQHPSLGSLAPGATTTTTTVAAFLAGVATDVDNPSIGIELLPASARVGFWQSSTDGGTTWTKVTKPTELASTAMIEFVASSSAKAGSYSLSFKAWDGTAKGGTALSKLTGTATLTIG
jgi:hypothetical protein